MSDRPVEVLQRVTEGGIAAKHPVRSLRVVKVAPTTDDEFNRITEELLPVACVRMDDIRFQFDSSFVVAKATDEFKSLHALRAEIPGLAVSVFGHADPVGDETYNKELSGRRSQAVYGLLTRKTDLWDDLFQNPHGRDNWKWKAVQSMLQTLGFFDGDLNGELDAKTKKAIADFQDSPDGAGSKPDSAPFPKTRKLIYLAYMNTICVDESGKPFQLDPAADFLAGVDKKGKGDYQGCGEFNPTLVFSKQENADFQSAPDKTERDKQNTPNRRVLLFLFPPGKHVKLDRWPCPRAKEGFALCRAQFFKSKPTGDERRAFQDNRREYKDTKDTFACRFYDRLALESPCEIGPAAVQSLLVRVHLRLRYLDPEVKPHNFPQDFPVGVALSGPSETEDHKVEADGKLTLTVARSRFPLSLTFATDGKQFIANATAETKGPGPERLVTDDQLKDVLADHYRVFKLPITRWDLETSEWSGGAGRVTSIAAPDPAAIAIASDAAPFDLTLDPHWQFLKFTYFDRKLKKKAAVPLGTLLVEGFRDVDAMFVTNPDTGSNWTISAPNECQCVPWILQSPKKPDEKILLQFETEDNTFVQSAADGTRTFVTGDPRNKPEAARLDFYDLPKNWKSRQYFARLSATDADRFEKLAAKPSTASQPVTFSLDDIVLTDKDLEPVAWKPDDRATIFANTFAAGANLSPIGVYRPDDAEPYLSKKPDIEKDRNYIADYPDWTRLVIAKGDAFDVFHKRTPDKDGQVVGARAGVRWDPLGNAGRKFPNGDLVPRPAAAPAPPGEFFVVQSFFRQEHASQIGTSTFFSGIGRFDLVILRCCDAAGDQEKTVNLHYFRFNFDFSPPADPEFASTPNTVAAGDQKAFATTTVQNIANRWNAKDDQMPDPVLLVPSDPAAHKLDVRVIWFLQAIPVPADAHYKIDVFKDVRAHMSSFSGHGAIQESDKAAETVNDPSKGKIKGWFTAAHETGHGDSLNDEYVEHSLNASWGQPGFVDSIPGSPYGDDTASMMNENREPRARHFWHVAEWLNALYGFAFDVKLGSLQYRLPANPDFPAQHRSFVNWPLKKGINSTSGSIPDSVHNQIGTGKYDLYLYPLGLEKYNNGVLPHGGSLPGGHANGLLMVVVKMVFSFLDTNELFPIFDFVHKVVDGVKRRFNETNKFFFTSAADTNISPCLIRFSPRILVRNFVDDDFIKKAMNISTAADYQKKVQDILTAHGKHFEIEVRAKRDPRWTPIVTPSPTGLGFTTDLQLDFGSKDSKNDTVDPAIAFAQFFAGMVGVTTGNQGATDANINNAASYQDLARKLTPDAVVQRMP